MHPECGRWGGRFRPTGAGVGYIDTADRNDGKDDSFWTVARWRQSYQNALWARMEWSTRPFAEANHEPVAVCNGDRGRRVMTIHAAPGTTVRLSAAGSTNPDGNALSYKWRVYREAGAFVGKLAIAGSDQRDAAIVLPVDAAGTTIHVILEVTDDGKPPLTAYRRVMVDVK
jgi:hypothetical protein